jgi:hypothetical protein
VEIQTALQMEQQEGNQSHKEHIIPTNIHSTTKSLTNEHERATASMILDQKD